ncbi:hypothetical protein [Granulibacter bethesdensis]|uniref:hypothetical protein n=1 Tax=Granulibacter bethesdensis TaxID=364410 RepID=UPI0003F212C7|nr:hypothetical protein [Granulibacter bethesdensis]AHJ64671.1 Hypothetical protein GbCGDNIH4_0285 [Granulibacter bethesdensis CGDNIH4]
MRRIMLTGAGLLAFSVAGAVYAQGVPPVPEGPAHGAAAPMLPPDHHHPFGPPPPPPSKAAFFRLHRGDLSVVVKCAEGENTKTCVDEASRLMDHFASVANTH